MFAEALKKRRQELGITQQELADKLFVSRQTVSNWENGKNYPDIPTLILISDYYSLSLDYLLKGDMAFMKKVEEDYKLIEKKKKQKVIQLVAGITQILIVLLAALGIFLQDTLNENFVVLGIVILCVPLVISSYLIYYASYNPEKDSSNALFIPKAYGPGITINPNHPAGKLIWGVIILGVVALLVYNLIIL